MSNIEWTDTTLNVATGCTKVSPGCKNCYMYQLYPRLKRMNVPGYEHSPNVVALHPQRLEEIRKWRKPRMVFVNSMSDTFHEAVPDHFLRWLFQAMRFGVERGHTFQVLTKRPDRAFSFWKRYGQEDLGGEWPAGIWLGTSVETQRYAVRVRYLERIPAPVRFVSAEPLLGPLDLRPFLGKSVRWVIVGGESGPKARPMETDWARDLRDQCEEHDVAFFLKQLGGRKGKRGGDKALLDGQLHHAMPEVGNGKS